MNKYEYEWFVVVLRFNLFYHVPCEAFERLSSLDSELALPCLLSGVQFHHQGPLAALKLRPLNVYRPFLFFVEYILCNWNFLLSGWIQVRLKDFLNCFVWTSKYWRLGYLCENEKSFWAKINLFVLSYSFLRFRCNDVKHSDTNHIVSIQPRSWKLEVWTSRNWRPCSVLMWQSNFNFKWLSW